MRGVISIVAIIASGPVWAQSAEERALVESVFETLQGVSIAENIEYCGYVGFDDDGNLVASPPTPGDESSCLSDDPVNINLITASYHTHGAYSPDYFNEVPSGADMEGDEDEGIDGWVATPGGRLWYIDTDVMETYQVCGLGCLPTDPNFVQGDMGIIQQSYQYDELVELLDQ